MAVQKMLSLERLKCTLDALSLPRTYFVCGQFLESMASMFGAARMRAALAPENPLCEIADHTYSHDVWKSIPTRPDKDPVSPATVIGEYRINSTLFEAILGQDLRARGVRAPLGYYQGIASEVALLDLLSKEGIPYVSSDLRDQDYSIEAPLLKNGEPRQPYRYSNGLVEIPSHGWQDTAFGGRSRTPVSESCPNSYAEIMGYYRCLFSSARAIADRHRRDFFLGLVLHPYSISFYDPLNELFADLRKTAEILGISFCQYRRVCQQFGPNWGSTTRILALGDDDSE